MGVRAGQAQPELLGQIASAVSRLDLSRFATWKALSELSRTTRQDGIEVDPDLIEVSGDTFSGPMDVYVLLDYKDRGETRTLAEGFVGSFHGHLDKVAGVVIDRVEVHTGGLLDE